MYKATCIICNKKFDTNSKRAKYCSSTCQKASYKKVVVIKKKKSTGSWLSCYEASARIDRLTMLSKALADMNIFYSYGKLSMLQTLEYNKFKNLEFRAKEYMKDK